MDDRIRLPGPARAYLSAFRIRFLADIQYRGAAWAGILTQFAWGLLYLMLYHACYTAGGVEPPMPFAQLAAYVWLMQAFLHIIIVGWPDGQELDAIVDGSVAYELIRPVSVYCFWLVKHIARGFARASLRSLPILIAASLLPGGLGMTPPPSFEAFGLFIVSLLLASLLASIVSMFICELTFITISPRGSRMIMMVFANFMAGILLPIPLMPKALQTLTSFLPFRYMADLPFRVYSGGIPPNEALGMIGIQLLWILGLGLLGIWGMNRAARRIVIQGG